MYNHSFMRTVSPHQLYGGELTVYRVPCTVRNSSCILIIPRDKMIEYLPRLINGGIRVVNLMVSITYYSLIMINEN